MGDAEPAKSALGFRRVFLKMALHKQGPPSAIFILRNPAQGGFGGPHLEVQDAVSLIFGQAPAGGRMLCTPATGVFDAMLAG